MEPESDPDLERTRFRIRLIKLMASTMLSAASNRQYSSAVSLFASFWQNLWNGNAFCICFVWVSWGNIKITNTLLERSAALLQLNWHLPNPARNLAGVRLGWISEKWPWLAGFRICRSQNLVQPQLQYYPVNGVKTYYMMKKQGLKNFQIL